ncbi:MAG: phosphoribosylformylglycinamidine synthase subunit PurL, partial [Bdellovibrionales bacterium]|nr:phosphoribosylformylglycinamidine synthase subunit PurL [Bdellovibrionales bacterium]
LCFGEVEAPRMPALIDGVVRGIAGYGNCVGVPMLTGQTEFHSSYNGNILVNAFALGLFRPGMKVVNSKARGEGNLVVYVGAKTGRDGVHGASMASESFADDSRSKKPTVQIGDPFFEKLLIESCLEVMSKDLVVAIQDMGAAGLSSSSFEMASKGGVGLNINLDKVPLRDASIGPEEILLSESQERMLLVCEPQKFSQLKAVFDHWNLDASIIGEVKLEKKVDLYWHGENICSIDPDLLVENAPIYNRAYSEWQDRGRVEPSSFFSGLTKIEEGGETLLKVLGSLHATSREWVYQQYDQRVGAATVRDCSDSVGVVRLPDSGRALGIVLGCRPYLMRWDAKQGGIDSVAYPALELACKGFEPLALTDCLNFGNPENPQLMSEFVASLEGMNSMCKALQSPVISGNVSFYNETMGKNVSSTPATGMVGLRPSLQNLPQSYFCEARQDIFLIRLPQIVLSGQYSELYSTQKASWGYGEFNTEEISRFVNFLTKLGRQEFLKSSRVVGKFGLAYALAKMAIPLGIGAMTAGGEWYLNPRREAESLFCEHYYEVLLALSKSAGEELKTLVKTAELQNLKLFKLGETGSDRLICGRAIDVPVKDLRRAYVRGWEENLETLA